MRPVGCAVASTLRARTPMRQRATPPLGVPCASGTHDRSAPSATWRSSARVSTAARRRCVGSTRRTVHRDCLRRRQSNRPRKRLRPCDNVPAHAPPRPIGVEAKMYGAEHAQPCVVQPQPLILVVRSSSHESFVCALSNHRRSLGLHHVTDDGYW